MPRESNPVFAKMKFVSAGSKGELSMFELIHLLSIQPKTYFFKLWSVASKYIYYDEKVSSLLLLNVLQFDQEEIDYSEVFNKRAGRITTKDYS